MLGKHPFERGSSDLANYLAGLRSTTLTGVFLVDNRGIGSLRVEDRPQTVGVVRDSDYEPEFEENVKAFKAACASKGVRSEILFCSFDELITESRFSDLIIVDAKIVFNKDKSQPSEKLMQSLLGSAECPVIVAAENFHSINEIIHCYDGSRSSVLAIKQFTYLFPELTDLKCILLQVLEDGQSELTSETEMKRWLKAHYSQCGFATAKGSVNDAIVNYVTANCDNNPITIAGSFGTNMHSSLAKQPSANLLLENPLSPLFIFHS